jgi:hypothetical protein
MIQVPGAAEKVRLAQTGEVRAGATKAVVNHVIYVSGASDIHRKKLLPNVSTSAKVSLTNFAC